MTDRELRRLSRLELIDIIYELQKQKESADTELDETRKKLEERVLNIANAGSIADAAVSINKVLEAAQAAADQYLLSVKAADAGISDKLKEAEQQSRQILRIAEEKSDEIIDTAEKRACEILQTAEKKASEIIQSAERKYIGTFGADAGETSEREGE